MGCEREWRPWLEVMEISYNAAFHQGKWEEQGITDRSCFPATHVRMCTHTKKHMYMHAHMCSVGLWKTQENRQANIWRLDPLTHTHTHTQSHWPLRSAERRKMEAHSLTGWVGWSAGLSGAVHLGILLKRFAHTRKCILFWIFFFISQKTWSCF